MLVVPFGMATASITFVGTSKPNLMPIPLPEELTVNSTESVVRRTELFRNHYTASVQSEEEYVPGEIMTEVKPGILLVRGSPVPTDGSVKSSPFGLIGTAVTAYGYHHNLMIRPDDIWITILSQFSYYVNARSDLLRDMFVAHEGKKELNVTVSGYNVYTAPYDDMTREFLDKISENLVDEALKDWFLPGFSTTTETDEVVAAATVMCTFQDYFMYVYTIVCGIPTVTLEGTVQDWELLASKAERLLDYDDGTGVLGEWVFLLSMVLSNFVESAKCGSSNLDFWDNICYYNSIGYGTSVLSGWITVFSFFDKDGQKTVLSELGEYSMESSFISESDESPRLLFPSLDQTAINPNVLSCPAIVDDNGVKYNATLFVGQMSFSTESVANITAETRSEDFSAVPAGELIRPRNDWALVIEEGEVELERPRPEDGVVSMGTETWEVVQPPSEICFWFEQPIWDGSNSTCPPLGDPTSPSNERPTLNPTTSSPTTERPTQKPTSPSSERPTLNPTGVVDVDAAAGLSLFTSVLAVFGYLCLTV